MKASKLVDDEFVKKVQQPPIKSGKCLQFQGTPANFVSQLSPEKFLGQGGSVQPQLIDVGRVPQNKLAEATRLAMDRSNRLRDFKIQLKKMRDGIQSGRDSLNQINFTDGNSHKNDKGALRKSIRKHQKNQKTESYLIAKEITKSSDSTQANETFIQDAKAKVFHNNNKIRELA
jgi:hypothetical protein